MLGEVLEATANGVTAGVTRKRIEPKESGVRKEHQCADLHVAPFAFRILKGQERIIGKNDVKNETGVEEPTVCILQDQWLAGFASVSLMWFSNGACWR